MHHHLVQRRQARQQPAPDPARQHLAGRIFQSLDLVEIVMIEPVIQRLECRLEIRKIHQPAQLRVGFARYVNLDAERMSVQPRTLVPGRHIRQAMRRFELEYLENVHRERLRAFKESGGNAHAGEDVWVLSNNAGKTLLL